jgi:hypothetical protein
VRFGAHVTRITKKPNNTKRHLFNEALSEAKREAKRKARVVPRRVVAHNRPIHVLKHHTNLDRVYFNSKSRILNKEWVKLGHRLFLVASLTS